MIASQDVIPGTRIDDFTIAFRIARGMSTDIFAVWHHKLRTPLICKRLRPEDAGHRKRRRLLRTEARVLKQLTHPGVVRLIAENSTGLPYLLLEHVAEKTLRDNLLEEGPFERGRAVRLVQHVAGAVAHLHDAGYLHRDIKPANVMLREGRTVLLDFGVAWKYAASKRPPDRSGTPQYLAPEQILQRPLGPAADVFGLGVLLFELLTNRRPFPVGPQYDVRDAALELRYPQLIEDPPKLHEFGCRAPQALEAVIGKCLARDARRRYQSVAELLTALDAFTAVKIWPKNACRRVKEFDPFNG